MTSDPTDRLSVDALHSLGLTAREAEVLQHVAGGKTNAEVGETLSVSPRTVQKHLEQVFRKLGVRSRSAAVACVLGLEDVAELAFAPWLTQAWM
jgi:DNA-binding CsgD family transcriptional regulator